MTPRDEIGISVMRFETRPGQAAPGFVLPPRNNGPNSFALSFNQCDFGRDIYPAGAVCTRPSPKLLSAQNVVA